MAPGDFTSILQPYDLHALQSRECYVRIQLRNALLEVAVADVGASDSLYAGTVKTEGGIMQILDLEEFPTIFRRFAGIGLKDAARRLDEIVTDENIPLNQSKIDQLGPTGFVASRMSVQPAIQAAIGGVEAAFRNRGISIAIVGEDHTYQSTSSDLKLVKQFATSMSYDEAVEMIAAQKPWNQGGLGGLDERVRTRMLLGKAMFEKETESYPGSLQDQARAQQLILLARGGMRFAPDLIIVEKGLQYDIAVHERTVIKEETIMNNLQNEFTNEHRSMALAAYIFLCVAGGDQTTSDRILIFIGERHKDIFDYFDDFALRSQTIPWVRRRPRTYLLLPSHVR
jgi:hypothetical protein